VGAYLENPAPVRSFLSLANPDDVTSGGAALWLLLAALLTHEEGLLPPLLRLRAGVAVAGSAGAARRCRQRG
jgi:hypothetical protein